MAQNQSDKTTVKEIGSGMESSIMFKSFSKITIRMALAFCFLNCAFGAKILKRDGQTIEGTIQGQVAVKSKVVNVIYQGKQYGAVFYVLIDGTSWGSMDATDVAIASGSYVLLTTSWLLSSGPPPPSDEEALAKAATVPSGSFPFESGAFDSGSSWVKLRVSSSNAGSVNALFAYPSSAFSSTFNTPSLAAKP